VVLPKWTPPAEALGGEYDVTRRTTEAAFCRIDAETTAALRSGCRAHGLTVSAAVNAAAVLCASDVLGSESDRVSAGSHAPQNGGSAATRRFKLLQALNMRRLGCPESNGFCGRSADAGGDWSGGSVMAGTGSLDILLELPYDSGASARHALLRDGSSPAFWDVARECASQTDAWLSRGWARESLLLFGAGWEFMNMNRVVELGAQDRSTLGRAYSCGTSNAGVFAHREAYDNLVLEAIYFGISQSVSAPSVSVSCITVGGSICLCTQWCSPIWGEKQGAEYGRAVRDMLVSVAGMGEEVVLATSPAGKEQQPLARGSQVQ